MNNYEKLVNFYKNGIDYEFTPTRNHIFIDKSSYKKISFIADKWRKCFTNCKKYDKLAFVNRARKVFENKVKSLYQKWRDRYEEVF